MKFSLVFAVVLTGLVLTTQAQDCDSDGLPDIAQLGPFTPEPGGGLRFLAIPNPAIIDLLDYSLSGQSFTIEMWVYRDAATGSQEFLLTAGQFGVTNASIVIGFRADNRFVFGFWNNDLETIDSFPPDGQWHHWMCRYDATNNFRWIFRDGVEVAFDVAPADFTGTMNTMFLGGLSSSFPLNGIIDELRIFDHVRSDVDVLNDLNIQYTQTAIPAGLHAYYPFDSANQLNDLAANNNGFTAPGPTSVIDYGPDCNANGVVDQCDIDDLTSADCNNNGIPDECEADCNANGIPDDCDIMNESGLDCNSNGIPDECEILNDPSTDLNTNGILDICEQIENITQGTYWADIDLAIANAERRDTIVLKPGDYGIVAIDEVLTIQGSDPLDPEVVDSTRLERAIVVAGGTGFDATQLRGLSIANISTNLQSGMHVRVERCSSFGDYEGQAWLETYGIGGIFRIVNCRVFGHLNAFQNFSLPCDGGFDPTGFMVIDINQSVFVDCDSLFGFASNPCDQYTVSSSIMMQTTDLMTPYNLYANIDNSIVRFGTSGTVPAVATFEHCNVIGSGGGFGTEVIDADPMFVDPDGPDDDPATHFDNDYRLLSSSACIDAGNNALLSEDLDDLDSDGDTTELTPIDLDDNQRIINSTVDIGPYEYQGPPPCQPDLTGEGDLNFLDVSAFLSAFGNQDPAADFTGEGQFNFLDVSAFLSAFGVGCP